MQSPMNSNQMCIRDRYNVLSHRLDEAMGVMQDIQQRDDNLYRVVLQADPVSDAVRKLSLIHISADYSHNNKVCMSKGISSILLISERLNSALGLMTNTWRR